MPEWNEERAGLLGAVLKRRRSPKGRRRVNQQLTNALAAALEEIERHAELWSQFRRLLMEFGWDSTGYPLHYLRVNLLSQSQAEQRIKELKEALRTQREESRFACSAEHGTAFIDEPGHELNCAHARRVIRMERAISSQGGGE